MKETGDLAVKLQTDEMSAGKVNVIKALLDSIKSPDPETEDAIVEMATQVKQLTDAKNTFSMVELSVSHFFIEKYAAEIDLCKQK